MHAHYSTMWESVACAHTVILSGHTTLLVQPLSIHINATHNYVIDIKFGIQTLLTYKLTILSIIISFVLENHQYLSWAVFPCFMLDYPSRNPLTTYVYETQIVLLMTIGAVIASSKTELRSWSSRSSHKQSMLFFN